MGKSKTIATRSSEIVPGVIRDSHGIAFSAKHLPSSDHFFSASDYLLDVDEENLYILFGQRSRFSKNNENKLRLAVEIVYPKKLAKDFLYEVIFNKPSIGAEDTTYFQTLEMNVEKDDCKKVYERELEIPDDPASYRRFSANFASSFLSHGQGLIEFYEAAPDMLVNLLHEDRIRPNSGVKSVVSVLAPSSLLHSFFLQIKEIFAQEVTDE